MTVVSQAQRPTPSELRQIIEGQGLRQVSPWASTAKLALVIGGWIGLFLAARAIDQTATWWAAWIAMAFLFEAMSAAVHEAGHDKLYRRRRHNRVAGWVMSAPRLLNFSTYQISHMEHHRHTHDRDRDPEPLFENTGLIDYVLYMIGSATVDAMILFVQGLEASFGRGPKWHAGHQHRRRARLGTLVVLAWMAVIVAGFRWSSEVMIQFWLMPFLLCNVLSSLVTKPEHYECEYAPSEIYDTTRTTYTNRVFGFLLWNINLHTAHHLQPTVPGHALPALHEYIRPHCPHQSNSYLRWHAGLIRSLARDRKGRTSMLHPRFWTSYKERMNSEEVTLGAPPTASGAATETARAAGL